MERQELINEGELRGIIEQLSSEDKLKVIMFLKRLQNDQPDRRKPQYMYILLRLAIAKQYKNQAAFAKATGMSANSLSRSLRNERPFKQQEITKCAEALELEDKDIQLYFFRPYFMPESWREPGR